MLAILARSGQFLPVCLTFGPTNGPEDFAFATDRVFAPGRNRKMRFCTNWQIYADDITVRSGRSIDGVLYTDAECDGRVKEAAERQEISQQTLDEAFKELGFDPTGLGEEKKEGRKATRAKEKAASKAKMASKAKPRKKTETNEAFENYDLEGDGPSCKECSCSTLWRRQCFEQCEGASLEHPGSQCQGTCAERHHPDDEFLDHLLSLIHI